MTKNNYKSLKAFDNPDFIHSHEGRPLRILSEYIEPEKRFKQLDIKHTVIFFGSARIKPEKSKDKFKTSKYYTAAEDFAYEVAMMSDEIEKETGDPFYICTGGGYGIMAAANEGAVRAKKKNIGLNIDLPFEQNENPFITEELSFQFHYFFMRKLWFLYQAKAIIVFPGGFGTLDELFETLTLIQTRKLEKLNIPILLYDKEYWEDLINFKKMEEYGLISPEDLHLFKFFNSTEEGIEILKPRLINIMKNIHHYLEVKFPI